MTKRDIAGYLGIDTKTLYNWEKDKPNLYKTVMKGLAYDEIVELNKKTYEKAKEMSEKFEKWDFKLHGELERPFRISCQHPIVK